MVKAHVGRWSEDCPEHQGCVVYSMADIPLGFGVVGFTLHILAFSRARLTTSRPPGVRPRRAVSTPRASCASGKQTAASTSATKTRFLLVNRGVVC